MHSSLVEIINSYNPNASLENAFTIPSSWYTNQDLYHLEQETVFRNSWQLAGRTDQLEKSGQYVTSEIAGEPIVVVRGSDNKLRGFFNVCRHHAAAVMTDPAGTASQLRCPYHGWTYSLAGELKGAPDFVGVCNFDKAANSLLQVHTATWANWTFVNLHDPGTTFLSLPEFLGEDLLGQVKYLDLCRLKWVERRHYSFDCNWKVFVDNYLDGGYHVPHLHKGLDSVLDYSKYAIENGERYCLQSSPLVSKGAEAKTGSVRKGKRALYYWIYPNFMINWYDGVMDTNLVIPISINRTEVIFDFYFADVSKKAQARNRASIEVGQRIQDEDVAICKSVQRGLNSRAYGAGRLSARREAGEHLFHRLLHADLRTGMASQMRIK